MRSQSRDFRYGGSAYYSITCASAQSSVAKVWLCSALIYASLYVADAADAADETCVRLMTLHPPIESFTFAKSSRFLNNSTPTLIDQVREKGKLSGDPAGSKGSVKTWAQLTPSVRQRGSIGTCQHRAFLVVRRGKPTCCRGGKSATGKEKATPS